MLNLFVAVYKVVLKGEKISDGWWRRLLEGLPNLTLQRGGSTAHVQMDQETVDQYSSLLGEFLMEHKLVDKPLQIYNSDERVRSSSCSYTAQYSYHERLHEGLISGFRKEGTSEIVGCDNATGHIMLFSMHAILTPHGQKVSFLEAIVWNLWSLFLLL